MEEDEINYQEDLENARLNQSQYLAVASQTPAERKEPLIDMLKDMPYFLAILMAIGKDVADFFGIGSSPAIGTLITILVMITIALLIFLAAPTEFFHNFMLLFGGTTIETIPVVNLLPVLTGAVVYIYVRKILQRLKKRMKKITGATRLANLATKAAP
ncbi:MAG: hypothetical protein AAB487_00175 [Patescibacteria group bacterium]